MQMEINQIIKYMKKKSFILIVVLLAIVLGAQAQPKNIHNGHEYVDLGLPSGTLWATMNIGADTPLGSGDFFAWGETDPKSNYSLSNYKWGNDATNFTKYNDTDGKTQLDLEDDAAHVNWGGDWHVPTYDQIMELHDNCEFVVNNEEKWMKITGPNGNTLYFSRNLGFYNGTVYRESREGLASPIWASTTGTYNGELWAYIVNTTGYRISTTQFPRYMGVCIRPVIDGSNISEIPDGWKVNGKTPINGKLAVERGRKITVTPKVPAGKIIKSIKLIPIE